MSAPQTALRGSEVKRAGKQDAILEISTLLCRNSTMPFSAGASEAGAGSAAPVQFLLNKDLETMGRCVLIFCRFYCSIVVPGLMGHPVTASKHQQECVLSCSAVPYERYCPCIHNVSTALRAPSNFRSRACCSNNTTASPSQNSRIEKPKVFFLRLKGCRPSSPGRGCGLPSGSCARRQLRPRSSEALSHGSNRQRQGSSVMLCHTL